MALTAAPPVLAAAVSPLPPLAGLAYLCASAGVAVHAALSLLHIATQHAVRPGPRGPLTSLCVGACAAAAALERAEWPARAGALLAATLGTAATGGAAAMAALAVAGEW
jgi:hypothetical protein